MVENWITIGYHQNTIGFLYLVVEKNRGVVKIFHNDSWRPQIWAEMGL